MAGPGAAGTPVLGHPKHAIPRWRASLRHLVIPPPQSGLCPQGPAVLARCSPGRAFSFWRPRTATGSCAPPAGAVRPLGGPCGQCQASDSPAPRPQGSPRPRICASRSGTHGHTDRDPWPSPASRTAWAASWRREAPGSGAGGQVQESREARGGGDTCWRPSRLFLEPSETRPRAFTRPRIVHRILAALPLPPTH